ncbi:latrophilin-like protein 1 [Babylonia areolata]|uniref:latrophilin-like protein 1 n=1 Tax=Babylonia areolata TaxID=304850 RepID=UPI003FD134BE
MARSTKPVFLLLLLSSALFAFCKAQSGDGSDDEDQLDMRTSYACENGMLTLECPVGHVIRIVRANYGRFSLTLCNPLGITSNMDLRCISITSRRIVATECDGHNRCEFQVTNQLFGDPCPGTSKYAEVKHYCEPEKIQVCMHRYPSAAAGAVYDIYWQMPETSQTILHFMLKYSVGEEAHEKEMPGLKVNDRYTFGFTPDEGKQREAHLFAIKAFSLDYGWGDYSDYSTPERSEGGSRPMCLAVDKMGVRWPETWPNEVRTDLCPRYLGQGLMYYKCMASGEWDPKGPQTENCIDVSLAVPVHSNSLITDMLRKLNRLSIKHAASLDLPSLLPRLTRDMANYLDSLPDPQLKKVVANYFKDSMLTLSDGLLKYGSAWNNMTVTQQRRTAASLLQAVEVTGLMTASTMDIGASNITRKSNIGQWTAGVGQGVWVCWLMKVMNIDLLHGRPAVLDGRTLTGPTMTKVNQFTIPPAVLHQVMEYDDGKNTWKVEFNSLNMSEWLAPEPNSGPIHSNVIDARPRREPVRRLVNSDIVSASVSKKPLKNLAEPVVFLMEHRQVESVENPKCSFWDTELSAWSSEGCWVFESNKTHTLCKCDHLTSFAVLMDITGATLLIPAKARFSLELITYIGCTISILCLMLSWVTFTCFKSLDCDRNTIHKHLVFCLMIAQIVLVVGVQQTKPAILCSIIAGLLHFFFLASFAWMCLEGVQLYVMLIEVFESERSRVLWYYLFGYGVPAVIVGTSAGIFPHGYGTEFHCWLSVERGFIWSFVGPAMAVMLINVIMLAIAIYIMVRHSTMSHTMRQKSAPQKMRTWVKGAVVLVVLLGLTWVFGVLYLDNVYHTLIFSYIFTVLNTLQGLFIFCFHCLLNDKVQKEYRRLVRHSHWLPDCVRVRYGGASSSGSREPSSSGNVMSRFLHGKKRHSAGGESSSNSTKPFLNKDPRHFSSSMPSSSDGATSSRLSTEISQNNNRKSSRSSTFRSNGTDSRSLRHSEVNGIIGDLSEVPDCSVVDSEFVSEYCQQNLRVSTEVKRYSSASEDSGRGDGIDDEGEEGNLDHLAALSVESLSNHPSYIVSSSDYGDGDKSDGWADSDNVDGEDMDEPVRYINLYAGQGQSQTDMGEEEEEEEEDGLVDGREVRAVARRLPETLPLVLKQTDSETVLINNAVNKPREMAGPLARASRQSPSLTDISVGGDLGRGEEEEGPHAHTSVPCLQSKARAPPLASYLHDRDAVNNSLPNLSQPHTSTGPQGLHNPSVTGQPSEGPVYFSPFRFPGSDC